MTTDPKAAALIERLGEQAARATDYWRHDDARTCTEAIQEIRDLTAENERRATNNLNLHQDIAELCAQVARLKALGDGLAEKGRHDKGCLYWDDPYEPVSPVCTCGLSAALAAWETRVAPTND